MYTIAALYHFTRFADPAGLKPALVAACAASGVTGTLLLAPEGINGTIAGSDDGITAVLTHIRALPGCGDLTWKRATSDTAPFGKMKVRLKKEIVTMGLPDIDPRARVGHYVAPADWNALIRDPDVVVIDTRNDYEVAIGTFEGALNPGTAAFGDFPAWWRANQEQFKSKRVAMFCTGGIRCEKSTNYLLSQGVKEVCHLQGGILTYLQEVPEKDSTWQGDCFVFDNRVSVGHGLRVGPHQLCHGCRRPILPQDRDRPEFEAGVSCHHCAAETSARDKARFRMRQKQIEKARNGDAKAQTP